METEFNVRLSLEVFIDLDDFDGQEITEQDIQNAFGSLDPVSEKGVVSFIKDNLDPEDIIRAGNIQDAKIILVEHSGKRRKD